MVIHWVAGAEVRPSSENTSLSQDINATAAINLLGTGRTSGVKKSILAAPSPVRESEDKVSSNENDKINGPSPSYSPSELADKSHCHTCNHLYGLPIIVPAIDDTGAP
jgi:nucleoside-diphosphate-sugar epimerase